MYKHEEKKHPSLFDPARKEPSSRSSLLTSASVAHPQEALESWRGEKPLRHGMGAAPKDGPAPESPMSHWADAPASDKQGAGINPIREKAKRGNREEDIPLDVQIYYWQVCGNRYGCPTDE